MLQTAVDIDSIRQCAVRFDYLGYRIQHIAGLLEETQTGGRVAEQPEVAVYWYWNNDASVVYG